MPQLHALELVPDEAGREQVRRDWQALHDAGLPSQLDHTGATNAPHVTVVAAPRLQADTERLAIALLEPLLPIRVRVSGVLLLGGSQLTVARSVDVDDEVIRAVLDVRAVTPGRQHDGWVPHVTLGRRIPREDAQRAVAAVGYDPTELALVELRRWDPERKAVVRLAPAG